MTTTEPGWYDDPNDASAQRWWDGRAWTQHHQPRPAATARPPVPPPSMAPLQSTASDQTVAFTPATSLPPPPQNAQQTAPAQGLSSDQTVAFTPTTSPPAAPQNAEHYPPPQWPVAGQAPGFGAATPPAPPQNAQHYPPPQWPPSGQAPQAPAAYGGAPLSPDGLASIKAMAAKVSITTGLVFGGLIFAILAAFLPFASISAFGVDFASVYLPWGYRLVVLALIAGAVALAWPALSGAPIVIARRIGLSVVTGLMVLVVIIAFIGVSDGDDEGAGIVDASPGFGLILYVVAVIVIIAGVVRLWIQHAKTTTSLPPPPPPNPQW